MEITIILIVVYILFYFSSRKESNAFDQALKSRSKSEPYFFPSEESTEFTGIVPNFGNPLMSAQAKQQYLQSNEWKVLKQTKLNQADYKCELCSSPYNLHLHHLTYERLGNEYLSDLSILCSECHQRQHNHYGYDRLTDYSILIKPKQSE